jgi:CheY-like chemotaxis protein
MIQILVAEDHEDARELLAEMLKTKVPNCEVIEVEDGLEAWLWLADHTPDLLVLDMMMPRMTGMELFHSMRRDDRLKNVPVVALTGIVLPFGEGFCRVLMKPVKFETLVEDIINCIPQAMH